MRHLYPDLMVPPGVQLYLYKRGAAVRIRFDCFIVKTGFFSTRRILSADAGGVGAGVFDQIVLKRSLERVRSAGYDSTVIFSKPRGGELAVQIPSGLRRFGKYEKSFHRLVEAVDDREIRGGGTSRASPLPLCRPGAAAAATPAALRL